MRYELCLGADPATGKPVMLEPERHLLAIAGAGAGKGACLIIPNLMRHWRGSAVVIDPKGEAAEKTANLRASAFGQDVAVCDPFGYADAGAIAASHFRSVNLLGRVRSADDCHMIADGIVMRTGRESETHWNDSAADIIAGIIAYICGSPALAAQGSHLGMLRPLLRLLQARDGDTLRAMASCDAFGGLAQDASARLSHDSNEVASVLATVQTQTRWLTSEKVEAWMARGADPDAVDLRALKRSALSLYLVLPPDRLEAQGRFLRLFVRAAISAMTEKAGALQKGTPCLMLLDEFYALGKMGEVQKAAAQMRSYGLHLFPFLQDWGQLVELYGEHGAQAFLANADAVLAFGVSDPPTLRLVSGLFGVVTPDEIEQGALKLAEEIESKESMRGLTKRSLGGDVHLVADRRLAVRLDLLKSRLGRPRRAPDSVQYEIGKPFGSVVAQAMYVFLRDGRIHTLRPLAYFQT